MKLAVKIAVALLLYAGFAAQLPRCEALGGESPTFDAADLEFFEREVRPLLVHRCHECHGAEQQKGGLRLDSRVAIVQGGDTGPAIEPGDPDESLLIDAIRYGDNYQMPPKSQLPQAEIEVLVRWVEMGAPWPDEQVVVSADRDRFDLQARTDHWAYQPLVQRDLPAVQNGSWPTAPLDFFLLAALEAHGVQPAPPVEKRVWLRRVTYDLIGLPPAPDELANFLADDSPAAYERVVERLLASPHYGERWARHWLDLVRYAETYGHEFDFDIPHAYQYRDYVVRALNADVPYDQFVREHIAGDLLASPRIDAEHRWNESIMGTGFFWLGEAKHSPVDARQDQAERIDNQIDVFSKAFLGLTVSCARCHDHKFDAISTRDYYALFGYLRSSRYQQAFVDLPEVFQPAIDALAELRVDEARTIRKLAATTSRDPARVQALFARLSTEERLQQAREDTAHPLHAYAVLADVAPEEFAQHKTTLLGLAGGSWPASADTVPLFAFSAVDFAGWYVTGPAFGVQPVKRNEVIVVTHDGASVPMVVRADAAHSGARSTKLRGTMRSETFTIEQPWLHYRLHGNGGRVRLILDGLQLIRDPIYGGLEFSPRSERSYWHAQDVSKWIGQSAYVEIVDDGDGYVALEQVAASSEPTIATDTPRATTEVLRDEDVNTAEGLRERYRALIGESLHALADGGEADPIIADWVVAELPELDGVDGSHAEQWSALTMRRQGIESRIPLPRYAPALADGTGQNEHVFVRGNHKQLGDEVPRRLLEVLAGSDQPPAGNGSGRLQLADRLIDDAGHLLARVAVNRVWKHHFGVGLVSTPDDFGVMGQEPSHADLLDFLAAEFIREGWSLKRLHRQMVLSSAYRMSSQWRAELHEIDPTNRLWHRMPVRRLEAECIRDAMLVLGGNLDASLGGASVAPHLTEFMQGRGRPATTGPLDGAGRRSIYLNVRRNFLSPLLLAFDYPTPFTTMGRRSVSNVPAQALAMLNNPFVHAQAQRWAERILASDHADDVQRINAMYEQAYGRAPDGEELSAALEFLAGRASGQRDAEVEAWTQLAHVLWNVKEFIWLE